MDIEMFGKISDAFGPSGFEEEVVRLSNLFNTFHTRYNYIYIIF